ncbi:hypothetical protein Peur_003018 [Populus x canadensis]
MAASLSTALDVHFTIPQSDTKRPIFFSFLATLPPQKHHPLQNHHKISQNHATRKTLLYLTISSLSPQPLSPPKTTKLNFCPNPSPHGSIPQDQKDLPESISYETIFYNATMKKLTALTKIYGKVRWAKDAMELWERMRSNNWPSDFILYNTLLNMCTDLGLMEEAEMLFDDMKRSEKCRPDSWDLHCHAEGQMVGTFTAMLNIYGSGGRAV